MTNHITLVLHRYWGISGAVNYGASVALALDELRRVNDGKENGIHFSDGATTYKL